MRTYIAVFFFTLAMLYAGQGETESRDSDRVAIKRGWVDAARNIAEETDDKEALQLVHAILIHSATAAFMEDGFRTIETSKSPGLYIIPILEEDPIRQEVFLRYVPGKLGFTQIIVPKIHQFDEAEKGIMLLQEVRLAALLIAKNVDPRDIESVRECQRQAKEFGSRLRKLKQKIALKFWKS